MGIAFKDFAPTPLRKGFFSLSLAKKYTSLDVTLEKLNRWSQANDIDVLNIETVVVPNLDLEDEGTMEEAISVAGGISGWYQFFRVWYRT